ncbi:MAG: ketopantoate reductase [halophilic archaeon J07HX64]|jgi:ketopantoate reductase (EC 1.1.1.169)|nr:MAG: ketopantoate reductase [halophilic archaeon J07HX64]
MEVCVFGAGSLGSLVGGLLADDHEVHLVGREPHVTAVREDGLCVTGEFDRTVYPSASTTPPATSDLALVTVKSFDTAAAARALADRSVGPVLSLQNGMGNEEQLETHLSDPVLAGTCTYGARLADPGVVECTGAGEITVGPQGGGQSTAADRVGETLSSGLETTVAEDMPRRLWEKLAVNAGINAVTALSRVPNGALFDGPATGVARDAARETAAVAADVGVEIPDAPAQTLAVAEATAPNTSSMQQDVLAGGRTEIDAINGYVVEQATQPVPVNATLTGLVRAWEQGRGLR